MIEQERFYVGSAKYAKDLLLFHKLQEEYLFLANNNIRTYYDLLNVRESKQNRIDEIFEIQNSIYKQNSRKKRSCKTDRDWREYQKWHMDEYGKMNELKAEKKEAKKMVSMVEQCLAEQLDTAIHVALQHDEINSSSKVQIPEFFEEKIMLPEVVVTDLHLKSNQISENQKQ